MDVHEESAAEYDDDEQMNLPQAIEKLQVGVWLRGRACLGVQSQSQPHQH